MVTPIPWPVRWMNCSPYPAAVITFLGLPVNVLARHARPYRFHRRLLRPSHDFMHLAYLGRGWPTETVRVVSEP